MRLRTIWSIPAMSPYERIFRTRDWAAAEIAVRLPRRIRYFATMHELGEATAKSPNIPATSLSYILKHMDAPKNLA